MNLLFKALNDPIRRDILDLLKEKDMSAGDIAEHFNIGKPTISHHLDLLKQAGLVTSENKDNLSYTAFVQQFWMKFCNGCILLNLIKSP